MLRALGFGGASGDDKSSSPSSPSSSSPSKSSSSPSKSSSSSSSSKPFRYVAPPTPINVLVIEGGARHANNWRQVFSHEPFANDDNDNDNDNDNSSANASASANTNTNANANAGDAATPDLRLPAGHKQPLRVISAGWDELSLTAYGHHSCLVTVTRRGVKLGGGDGGERSLSVRLTARDVVIVRASVHCVHYDARNVLYGLRFANVHAVNSLDSVCRALERPLVAAELLRVQAERDRCHHNDDNNDKDKGRNNDKEKNNDAGGGGGGGGSRGRRRGAVGTVRVVESYYYSSGQEMVMSPCTGSQVVKLGPFHAGIGKALLSSHHAFEEAASLVQATPHYATAEAFIDYDADVRVQVVGDKVWAFARRGCTWKSNTATGVDVVFLRAVPDELLAWVDACRRLYDGGLDIFSLDVLYTEKAWRNAAVDADAADADAKQRLTSPFDFDLERFARGKRQRPAAEQQRLQQRNRSRRADNNEADNDNNDSDNDDNDVDDAADGEWTILELNDTATGWHEQTELECARLVRDRVLALIGLDDAVRLRRSPPTWLYERGN